MSEQSSRNERIAAYAVLFLTLLLRVVYIFRYRFDSDEPQHLHVVWGWAHGLLQYRDVFDNHAPLFHLLCVPLYKMFGDNLRVLFAMRLAMLPLFIIALWCVFLIGREIYSSRVGLWAAVFTGLFPLFFLCSVEFRTDNLWTVFWLLAVAVLIKRNLNAAKCFGAGLLLGAAMGVSMKTTLLLVSLGAGALATIVLSPGRYISEVAFKRLCTYAVSLLAGLCAVPVTLLLFFYSIGDLGPLFYGTVTHNIFPGLGLWHKFYVRILIFPVSLAILYWFARIIGKNTAYEGQRSRRIFIYFIGGIYFSALKAFWPVLEWQHYLPFYPLLFIFLTPVVLQLVTPRIFPQPVAEQVRHLPGWAFPAFVLFLEVSFIFGNGEGAPWHDGTRSQIQLLRDVLHLTEPGDFVADLKGEMIFRQRSPYYILEKITRARIKHGLLADDIPERLIATRTCVAALDSNGKFPSRAGAFIRDNYIPVGILRVAGKLLQPDAEKNSSILFDVQLPASYVVINKNGHVSGQLDGTPYTGARFLQAGHHELHLSAPYHGCALLWERAYERGYSPFI